MTYAAKARRWCGATLMFSMLLSIPDARAVDLSYFESSIPADQLGSPGYLWTKVPGETVDETMAGHGAIVPEPAETHAVEEEYNAAIVPETASSPEDPGALAEVVWYPDAVESPSSEPEDYRDSNANTDPSPSPAEGCSAQDEDAVANFALPPNPRPAVGGAPVPTDSTDAAALEESGFDIGELYGDEPVRESCGTQGGTAESTTRDGFCTCVSPSCVSNIAGHTRLGVAIPAAERNRYDTFRFPMPERHRASCRNFMGGSVRGYPANAYHQVTYRMRVPTNAYPRGNRSETVQLLFPGPGSAPDPIECRVSVCVWTAD